MAYIYSQGPACSGFLGEALASWLWEEVSLKLLGEVKKLVLTGLPLIGSLSSDL
jgi:hypothetical protein